jgi:hypothetical protein
MLAKTILNTKWIVKNYLYYLAVKYHINTFTMKD